MKKKLTMALAGAGTAAVLALAGCGSSGSSHHTPASASSPTGSADDGGSRGRAAEKGTDPGRAALDHWEVHRWTETGGKTRWMQIHITVTNHTDTAHDYYFSFGVYAKSDLHTRLDTMECDVLNVPAGETASSDRMDCAQNDAAGAPLPVPVDDARFKLASTAVN
jgi:hypothetical protein